MAAVGLDPRYGTHTCRQSYATHLYRASGADLEIVQEQLGHASIKTTAIYAKITKEDKARAAEALAKAYRDSQQNRNLVRVGLDDDPEVPAFGREVLPVLDPRSPGHRVPCTA